MFTRPTMHLLVILLLVGVGGCYTLEIGRLNRDIRDLYTEGADSTIAITGMPYQDAVALSRGRDVIVGVVVDTAGGDSLELVRGRFHAYADRVEDTSVIRRRIERLSTAKRDQSALSLYRRGDEDALVTIHHYRTMQIDAIPSADRTRVMQIDMDHVAFVVDVDAQDDYSSGQPADSAVLIFVLSLTALVVGLYALSEEVTNHGTLGCLSVGLLFVGSVVGLILLLM